MPLRTVEAAHIRVICDGCRTSTAEVCPRRELPVTARGTAMRKFKAVGWHHDPGSGRKAEQAERDGGGRWYCPSCARQTHL
jgi:hypothetical protein